MVLLNADLIDESIEISTTDIALSASVCPPNVKLQIETKCSRQDFYEDKKKEKRKQSLEQGANSLIVVKKRRRLTLE